MHPRRPAWAKLEPETPYPPERRRTHGPLFDELFKAFKTAAKQVPSVDRIEEAPLAIQGAPPAPGLFSFDKYSSAPILITAVREDIGDARSRGAPAAPAAGPRAGESRPRSSACCHRAPRP
jgi:hypothetical protein